MNQQELEDRDSMASSRLISQYPKSWLAAWPEGKGIRDSTIFRHIQHCETLKEGNFQQETIRTVNSIPHLEVASEDKEDEYLAAFANGARLRVRSADPDNISAMKKDKYTLKETRKLKAIRLSSLI